MLKYIRVEGTFIKVYKPVYTKLFCEYNYKKNKIQFILMFIRI